MYFYGIMSQKPTCLYRTKDKNFVIIEKTKSPKGTIYELLINPLSNKDALDICLQEDTSIAKMMLAMQLYDKSGNEENIVGKENEIILASGQPKEIKTALALIKNIDSATVKDICNTETFDETEHQEVLRSIQKSFSTVENSF